MRNRSARVREPTPTRSTPVAPGSSVPEWPIRRSPRRRRSRATTSWLVTPAGLSTTTSPWTTGGLRRARVAPVGSGGGRPDARRAGSARCAPLGGSPRPAGTAGPGSCGRGSGDRPRPATARDGRRTPPGSPRHRPPRQGVVVDDRPVQVGVDLDRRDADELEARIVDALELLGHHLTQQLPQAGGPGTLARLLLGGGAGRERFALLIPATSCRSAPRPVRDGTRRSGPPCR